MNVLQDRFREMLTAVQATVYSELPSELHTNLSNQMIEWAINVSKLPDSSSILDLGAGCGMALEMFKSLGHHPVGVNFHQDDVDVCVSKGFTCAKLDINNLYLLHQYQFDMIWARHIMEHSPCPLFVLQECHRKLRDGGYMYVEVPAPGTSAKHDSANANHLSVLTGGGWARLFHLSKFDVVQSVSIPLELQCGPDTYFCFLLRKA